MKRAVLITLFLLLCSGRAIPGQQAGPPLTNDSIIKLVKAGLSEDTIVSIINTQPGKYSLGADDIIALKKAGVPEKVITAMLNKSSSKSPHADEPSARGAEPRGLGAGQKAIRPEAGASETIRARGYKDEDGMYRASRADDGEAQYQFDAINEDLITLVPMCKSADPGMKAEIDKSLRLSEYQLSNLMGRDEAKAFRSRVEEEGCLGGVSASEVSPNDASGQRKGPEAQTETQKAAELGPSHTSKYYYDMAVVLVNKGKIDEAIPALKKSTELDPTNANAFYWYGMALLGKAEFKDGTIVPAPGTVEAFETYLKLDPYGNWAESARESLEILQRNAPVDRKARKNKKG